METMQRVSGIAILGIKACVYNQIQTLTRVVPLKLI